MSTTPIKIQVWTDFVCPFCLLGESIIEKAIEGLNVEVEWMPFELRPYPTPTLKPEDEYLPRVWKASVYPMAERLGVPIQLPTVSPQPYTRKAFLGLQYAKQQGKGNEYTTAVMKAFFQQNLNIGEDQVLKNILANLGLNRPDSMSLSARPKPTRNTMLICNMQSGSVFRPCHLWQWVHNFSQACPVFRPCGMRFSGGGNCLS